jgi:two-component system, LytTR family, response regulator
VGHKNFNQMKAIIVDDEKTSCETLKVLLHDFCESVSVVATCQTITDAVKAIGKHKPDVVFLDINMKGENGFDLLEKIKPINFEIVFATAYSEYAIKAFKFSAIDYLLKPIDIEELKSAVSKVAKRKEVGANDRFDLLLQNLKPANEKNYKLALPSATGLIFVKIADIIYCEADSNYTTFFLQNEKKIIVSHTLKHYEELLSPHRFFRIHHSYLVNLDFIKQYIRGDGGQVILQDDTALEVAKRRKEEFLKLYSG